MKRNNHFTSFSEAGVDGNEYGSLTVSFTDSGTSTEACGDEYGSMIV
jgi:hypothetical protein